MPGQRVGLVGANGCGKSTLLRCLSGQRKIDNGRLVVGRSVEMGYLEQTAVSGSDRTVWEEARSRMTELIEAEAAIDAASQAATAGMVGGPTPSAAGAHAIVTSGSFLTALSALCAHAYAQALMLRLMLMLVLVLLLTLMHCCATHFVHACRACMRAFTTNVCQIFMSTSQIMF